MSGARPHSAGWHVLVAGFGLKPMVGSMQRTRVWLAHCIGCRKHAIRSGSCWPLTSLVLEDAWSKGNIGPPGQETHGPPKTIGIWRSPVKDGSSKQQRATLPQEFFDSADGI